MAHFCTIFDPVVFHIPGFGLFRLHKGAGDWNACFDIRLKGVYIFWLQVVHGDALRNIPTVSASAAETTIFFCVWQTVRMGPFSFGLGVSVGGGWLMG